MSVIPQLSKHAHYTACPQKLTPSAFYEAHLQTDCSTLYTHIYVTNTICQFAKG